MVYLTLLFLWLSGRNLFLGPVATRNITVHLNKEFIELLHGFIETCVLFSMD